MNLVILDGAPLVTSQGPLLLSVAVSASLGSLFFLISYSWAQLAAIRQSYCYSLTPGMVKWETGHWPWPRPSQKTSYTQGHAPMVIKRLAPQFLKEGVTDKGNDRDQENLRKDWLHLYGHGHLRSYHDENSFLESTIRLRACTNPNRTNTADIIAETICKRFPM